MLGPIKNYRDWKAIYESSNTTKYEQIDAWAENENWSKLAETIHNSDAVNDAEAWVQYVISKIDTWEKFEKIDTAMKNKSRDWGEGSENGVWGRIEDFMPEDEWKKDWCEMEGVPTIFEMKETIEADKKKSEDADKIKEDLDEIDDWLGESDRTRDNNEGVYEYEFSIEDRDPAGPDDPKRYEDDPEEVQYKLIFYSDGRLDVEHIRQSGWIGILGGRHYPSSRKIVINNGPAKYKKEIENIDSLEEIPKEIFRRKPGSEEIDGSYKETGLRPQSEKEFVGVII